MRVVCCVVSRKAFGCENVPLRLESVNSAYLAVLLARCSVSPLFNSSDLDLQVKLKMRRRMASLVRASRGEGLGEGFQNLSRFGFVSRCFYA